MTEYEKKSLELLEQILTALNYIEKRIPDESNVICIGDEANESKGILKEISKDLEKVLNRI